MRPDEYDEASDGGEDEPQIEVPSAPSFPPPPEVQFTRPTLGRGAPGRAFSRPDNANSAGAPLGGSEDNDSDRSHLSASLVIGVTFPSCIVVGALIGAWIDERWPGASPWGIVVMSLAGIAAGFLNIFRVMAMMDRRQKPRK